MKCKDKRIRAMYEILNSIKIIKYNAWEEIFGNKARKGQTKNISRILHLLTSLFLLKAEHSFFAFFFTAIRFSLTSFSFFFLLGGIRK